MTQSKNGPKNYTLNFLTESVKKAMEDTQDAKTIRKDTWKNIIKGNDKGEINPLHVCNPIEFWWFKNLVINACTVCTRLLKIPQEWIWLFHHTGSYTFYTVSWCMWLKFVPKWMNKLLHVMDHWSPFSSVQFSHSVVSDSLWPHELQHTRLPCLSPTLGVYSNSCPSSWWCRPAISSSVVPFSSCPQSFPASGSFAMSQLFAWGGQSIGVSTSVSVLPMNTQDWSQSMSPLGVVKRLNGKSASVKSPQ